MTIKQKQKHTQSIKQEITPTQEFSGILPKLKDKEDTITWIVKVRYNQKIRGYNEQNYIKGEWNTIAIYNAEKEAREAEEWILKQLNPNKWGDEFMVECKHHVSPASLEKLENTLFVDGIVRIVTFRKLKNVSEFSGTDTELLNLMAVYISHRTGLKYISSPRAFIYQLKRFTPALRAAGVEVSYNTSNDKHLITLTEKINYEN